MKKKLILLTIVTFLFLTTACTKDKETDGEKFAKEYTQVSEYNAYVYRDINEIIKILEHGTGIIYLGFPECPWCQAYVPILSEVADTEGLEKIYYFNIYNDRKDNTQNYQKIVSIIEEYLQYDDEGNKRIYVPAIIAVSEGKIVGYNDETSYDTLGYSEPNEYWTEERIKQLKPKLANMINEVLDNKCTDCNK